MASKDLVKPEFPGQNRVEIKSYKSSSGQRDDIITDNSGNINFSLHIPGGLNAMTNELQRNFQAALDQEGGGGRGGWHTLYRAPTRTPFSQENLLDSTIGERFRNKLEEIQGWENEEGFFADVFCIIPFGDPTDPTGNVSAKDCIQGNGPWPGPGRNGKRFWKHRVLKAIMALKEPINESLAKKETLDDHHGYCQFVVKMYYVNPKTDKHLTLTLAQNITFDTFDPIEEKPLAIEDAS